MASPPAPSKSSTVQPVISDEADKALRPWVIFGLPLVYACFFLLPVLVGVITALFPKNHWISGFFGIPILLGAVLWLVPMYYVFTNVYRIRLEYGRKYIAERKWREADAALGSTDPLMLKFFDRTGEAHYLWAQALDGLGKKSAAIKARDWLRKRRPHSVYTSRLTAPVVGISQIKKAAVADPDESHASGTRQPKKMKRRRF